MHQLRRPATLLALDAIRSIELLVFDNLLAATLLINDEVNINIHRYGKKTRTQQVQHRRHLDRCWRPARVGGKKMQHRLRTQAVRRHRESDATRQGMPATRPCAT